MSVRPKKHKLVIDTDAGTDDAQAICMALASPEVEILGFTTVHGNVDPAQGAINLLRLLHTTENLEIPIHVGSKTPLLGDVKPSGNVHGSDGFGDMPNPEAVDVNLIRTESAIDALERLSKEHEGDLTLIAIGPLTNIAEVIRRDAKFGSRLKQCYIMGGNYYGKGNSASLCAEFNFYCDPEAAYIVLNQLQCPITLVGMDTCYDNTFSWEMYTSLRQIDTRIGRFFKTMEEKVIKTWSDYIPCDEYAMAALFNPEHIVLESKLVYASVELKGDFTRGMMVIDWNSSLKKEANVTIVTKSDREVMFEMIKSTMQWK